METKGLIQGAVIDKDREESKEVEHVELVDVLAVFRCVKCAKSNLSDTKELGCVTQTPMS